MVHPFPEIRTSRLLLRQFNDEDLLMVHKGLSDPEVVKYYGVSYTTVASAKRQMKYFQNLEVRGTGIWWAVCSADNQVFYGACGFNNYQKQHRKAETGYWLLPDYWGRGLMVEAMSRIIQYGFEHLNLHRIEALVEPENIYSKNLLHSLNFMHEGTMKECEYKDGKFLDLEIYALIQKANEALFRVC